MMVPCLPPTPIPSPQKGRKVSCQPLRPVLSDAAALALQPAFRALNLPPPVVGEGLGGGGSAKTGAQAAVQTTTCDRAA